MSHFLPTAGTIATVVSLTRLAAAITAFTTPTFHSKMLGFPDLKGLPNAFIPFSAARGIGLDLVVLTFSYQRDWRSVSIVLFCMVPVACLDAAVTWRFAPQKSYGWVHFLGSFGIAGLAWALKGGQ